MPIYSPSNEGVTTPAVDQPLTDHPALVQCVLGEVNDYQHLQTMSPPPTAAIAYTDIMTSAVLDFSYN